jgi:hypothetical protein
MLPKNYDEWVGRKHFSAGYCPKPYEPEPLFTSHADATLTRVADTYKQRGEQYGDTWRHNRHLALEAVLRTGNANNTSIAAAVLLDVKYSRLLGGYKDDTLVDLIAYAALLAEEMRR